MISTNLTDGGGGSLGSTPRLNNNQFGKTLAAGALGGPVGLATAAGVAAAPKVAKAAGAVAKAAAPVAVKAAGSAAKAGAGAGMQVAKAVGGAAVASRLPLLGPAGAGAAAAYGASQTPGGKSIIKGAVKGAGGPNMGVSGPVGAAAGAIKGAVTSQGAKNVASGMGKGALIGAIGGPVGSAIGAGIGAIGGLFSNRGMGQKPTTPKAPGSAVPNRATPYTVQKGDTLTSIAKAKGTTVDALRKANPKFTAPGSKYNNGNMIWSGTKVNLK